MKSAGKISFLALSSKFSRYATQRLKKSYERFPTLLIHRAFRWILPRHIASLFAVTGQ